MAKGIKVRYKPLPDQSGDWSENANDIKEFPVPYGQPVEFVAARDVEPGRQAFAFRLSAPE